jgi:hypothetical protein
MNQPPGALANFTVPLSVGNEHELRPKLGCGRRGGN